MLKCKKCSGTDLKGRTNYSHGSGSGSNTTFTCKKCGSTQMETVNMRRRRRR